MFQLIPNMDIGQVCVQGVTKNDLPTFHDKESGMTERIGVMGKISKKL